MATKPIYALREWTVEKRAGGWYFAPTYGRDNKECWKGPYASPASVALMLARELRKEIERRHGSVA